MNARRDVGKRVWATGLAIGCLMMAGAGVLLGQQSPPDGSTPADAASQSARQPDVGAHTEPPQTDGEPEPKPQPNVQQVEAADPSPVETPDAMGAAGRAASEKSSGGRLHDTSRNSNETYPAGRGVIIPITAEISDVTYESVKRRVEMALADGVEYIIFEIDTPGGYVTSALEICDYIKNLTGVRTIAWINTQAYSAGSMIAVACDEIVMTRSSVLGDCGVILGGPTGPQEVPEGIRAKAESPVIEQFRDSAAKHGYDTLLCEAMVVREYEVYWIENVETGERRFVTTEDRDRLIGDKKEQPNVFGLKVPTFDSSESDWREVTAVVDPVSGNELKIHQPVVKKTELLTMSQSRAHAFGFSKAIVNNVDDLITRYHLDGTPSRVNFTWSEVFTRWLTSMPVRGFLLIVIFLGIYVEFNTPGVGVPGLVAVIALAVFVAAPYLTGLANVWEVVAVLLGLVLLALEIFVIPGFGVAGISGITLLLLGLLATFVPDEPGRFPIHWPSFTPGVEGLKRGVVTLASSLVTSVIGMVLLSKYLPQMPYFRKIMPANPTPAEVLASDPYDGVARVGELGTTVGPLRPVGRARFSGMLVDVVSQGEMIEPGTTVVVIERHGNRVVVQRAQET